MTRRKPEPCSEVLTTDGYPMEDWHWCGAPKGHEGPHRSTIAASIPPDGPSIEAVIEWAAPTEGDTP